MNRILNCTYEKSKNKVFQECMEKLVADLQMKAVCLEYKPDYNYSLKPESKRCYVTGRIIEKRKRGWWIFKEEVDTTTSFMSMIEVEYVKEYVHSYITVKIKHESFGFGKAWYCRKLRDMAEKMDVFDIRIVECW